MVKTLISMLGSKGEEKVAKGYFEGDRKAYLAVLQAFNHDAGTRATLRQWQAAYSKDRRIARRPTGCSPARSQRSTGPAPLRRRRSAGMLRRHRRDPETYFVIRKESTTSPVSETCFSRKTPPSISTTLNECTCEMNLSVKVCQLAGSVCCSGL